MNPRLVIALLVAANLALAGSGYLLWKRYKTASAVSALDSGGEPSSSGFDERRDVSDGGSVAPDAFAFRMLLSTDLRKYIDNLRRVDCPEPTVQDIIIAEVHRRYAAREAALGVHRHHQNPWDVRPSGRGSKDWKKWNLLRELREEKRALVKDLLGVDLPLDMPVWSITVNADFEQALLLLPEEKRAAARELLEKYRDVRRELEERTGGYFLPEDVQAYKKGVADRRKELEALLGESVFEKFEMAATTTGRSLKNSFEGFDLSEDEMLRLFRSRRQMEDVQIPGQVLGLSPAEQAAYEREIADASQRVQQGAQDVRNSMSPDRQAEFDRVQDGRYRQTLQRVTQAGLPRETAAQVYDFTRSLQSDFNNALREASTDPQQRQQFIKQFYDDNSQRLREMIGEDAFNRIGGLGRIPGLPRFADPRLQQRFGIAPTP